MQCFFLVCVGGEELKVVLLLLVMCLEEFDLDIIEYINGYNVVQYCGCLMLIVLLGDQIQCIEGQCQLVLVFVENYILIGLVVDEIVDVVEECVDLQMGFDCEGVIGLVIIKGKVIDVVDIVWYFDQFCVGDIQCWMFKCCCCVLFVDVDVFVCCMIVLLLVVAGYDVMLIGGMYEVNFIVEVEEQFDVLVGDLVVLVWIQLEGMWVDLLMVVVMDWLDDGSGEGLMAVLLCFDCSVLIVIFD